MLASSFQTLDFVALAAYFLVIGGMGYFFSRRPQTTGNYFLGGNKIPSWAIGLSMLATSISSVTFLAFPAAAFALDWRQLVPSLLNPLVAIFAIVLLIPLFRRTCQVSAFEYIEKRYGVGARSYSALMFLVVQAVRLGSILYLISIPLHLITGVDPFWIMTVTGAFVAIYTILGGIEAVVWTDVVQAFVLYFGGIIALAVMLGGIEGGFFGMMAAANEEGKLGMGPMHWDMGERTFWALAAFGVTQWLYGYSADQNVVQRYLAAKDLKEARKATILCALLSLPTWALFFLLGTAMFVFYQQNPDPSATALPADAVFPQFILDHMPAGLSGLVIAGVLSAAMSSLSSSLNSFATVSTIDFVKPYFIRGKSDRFYAIAARILTLLAAILMFVIAFAFTHAEKESFFDLSLKIMGLIGGVVVSFFLLGFFAPQVRSRVLWQAFALAISVNFYFLGVELGWFNTVLPFAVHSYWVMFLSNAVMIISALILALFQPSNNRPSPGLTLFGRSKSPEHAAPSSVGAAPLKNPDPADHPPPYFEQR